MVIMNEEEVIESIRKMLPSYAEEVLPVGIGDDCAVCQLDDSWDLLLKTDVVVSGIHFYENEDPYRVGKKAIARAISDIAAMGGIPQYVLVTFLSGQSVEKAYVQRLYQGILDCTESYGVILAGGETSRLSQAGVVINISLTGRVEKGKAVLRSTAQAGDLLFVTGNLGQTLGSEHHLDFTPRVSEGRFLQQNGWVTSMMDISDGLGKDLPTLCRASGLEAWIDPVSLPRRGESTVEEALNDGEDYELLFTVSVHDKEKVERFWNESFPNTQLSCIGFMTLCSEEQKDGTLISSHDLHGGWCHFSR